MIAEAQESGCAPQSSVYDVASLNGRAMRQNAKPLAWILWLSLAALLPAAHGAHAAELKTSKERLSNKAADDQRVDNCRVPPDQRGTAPRPDCGEAEKERVAPDQTRSDDTNRNRN
jgi:hypothetical protein